jgi:hypothetical protein
MPVHDTHAGTRLQKLPPLKGPAQDSVGGGAEGDREGKDQFEIRDLSRMRGAARRYWTSSSPRKGRLVPPPAEEEAQSEASEWEFRERREREVERRQKAEEVGVEDKE